MKKILKSINVAFSLYSQIPMPRFIWESEDMKYHLIFFPWVGAVIGFLEYVWHIFSTSKGLPLLMQVCISISIPILVTGGFHIDGFLDSMDAFHSFQSREKKLEILKDPHIGAFSVICFANYLLLACAFCSILHDKDACICMAFIFFISRTLSGLGVTYFDKAKKEGMVATSSNTVEKKTVGTGLMIEYVLSYLVQFFLIHNLLYILVSFLTTTLVFGYYYRRTKKEFGGITGDLAGWFICICELGGCIALSILNII